MPFQDWKSVDKKVFTISSNGGKKFNLDDNISIGNYNILMCESPLYNAVKETNQSSHDLFRNVFKTGFAWEVLQVFSGESNEKLTLTNCKNLICPSNKMKILKPSKQGPLK